MLRRDPTIVMETLLHPEVFVLWLCFVTSTVDSGLLSFGVTVISGASLFCCQQS